MRDPLYDQLTSKSDYEKLRDWLAKTQSLNINDTIDQALHEGILEHYYDGRVRLTASTNDTITRIKASVGNDLEALKTEINTSVLKIVMSLAICSGAAYWAYKENGNQPQSIAVLLCAFALAGCIFFPCMELIKACKKNSEKEKKQQKIRACTVFIKKVCTYNQPQTTLRVTTATNL